MSVSRDVAIPVRDGTRLAADIYRPDGASPRPTLLHRTPYGKHEQIAGGSLDGNALIAAGFNLVVQDVRGCFASGGRFVPYANEAGDGADTVAWIEAQPWSLPAVGMIGRSYAGCAQWLAATSPRAPAAIAPEAASADFFDGWTYRGGTLQLGFCLRWLLEDLAPASLGLSELCREPWRILGHAEQAAPYYRDWLEHPRDDAYWRGLSARARFDRLTAPALVVAGWRDILLPGALADFAHLRHSGGVSAETSRLVIGPWSHLLPRDLTALHVGWFGRHLLRAPPAHREPRVSLYVTGAGAWRDLDDWPPPGARTMRLHLRSGGHANTSSGDGVLAAAPPGNEPADSYVGDPTSPVPSVGDATAADRDEGASLDRREVERRSDVLCYTTTPLDAPLTVAGEVKLVLFASSSALDADFVVTLADVHPDGCVLSVCDGVLRTRYRRSLRRQLPLTPGRVYRFVIQVGAAAHVFQRGHCVRLEIAGSSFPRYDVNANTGGPSLALGPRPLVPARIFVHHAQGHPSHLILPKLLQFNL